MALSTRHRRTKGLKPPTGIGLSYAAVLRQWFHAFQTKIAAALGDWESNTVAFGFGVRSDSGFVRRKLAAIKLELEQTFSPSELDPHITRFAERVSKRGKEEFRRVIGISSSDVGVKSQLTAFRERNVNLIKSLAEKQVDEIEELLTEAETGAWRVEVLREKIQDRFDVTKSKADLLARDQILKLNGQLTRTRQTGAGITRYIWTTSRDERVRPAHADLEGVECSWSDPPVISEDGRTGHPGDDYQCRCTPFPILPELDEDGEDE